MLQHENLWASLLCKDQTILSYNVFIFYFGISAESTNQFFFATATIGQLLDCSQFLFRNPGRIKR